MLRPLSYFSTMAQMIGRGMRPAPGKKDCVVLDFRMSLQIHSRHGLQQIPDLDGEEQTVGIDEPTGDDESISRESCGDEDEERSAFSWFRMRQIDLLESVYDTTTCTEKPIPRYDEDLMRRHLEDCYAEWEWVFCRESRPIANSVMAMNSWKSFVAIINQYQRYYTIGGTKWGDAGTKWKVRYVGLDYRKACREAHFWLLSVRSFELFHDGTSDIMGVRMFIITDTLCLRHQSCF